MRIYIDSTLVVDFLQGNVPYSGAVTSRIVRPGVDLVFTDLSRMEVLAAALRPGSGLTRQDVDVFFAPNIRLELAADVFERAAEIRAAHDFAVVDSIHLAAATVHGSDEFLTRKRRLRRYTGVRVQVV